MECPAFGRGCQAGLETLFRSVGRAWRGSPRGARLCAECHDENGKEINFGSHTDPHADRPTSTPTPLPGEPTPTPEPTATPKPALDPQAVAAGRALFVDVGCDLCHGAQAEGTKDGPALRALTRDRIVKQVRAPVKPPDSPYPKTMKALAPSVLSDQELAQIADYLLSLQ